MTPYPKYKPSGILWIGEIPEHWKYHKLKYSLSTLESGSRETGGGNIAYGVFSLGGEHIGWFVNFYFPILNIFQKNIFLNLRNGQILKGDVLLVRMGNNWKMWLLIKNLPFEKMCSKVNTVFILRANEDFISEFDILLHLVLYWKRTNITQH